MAEIRDSAGLSNGEPRAGVTHDAAPDIAPPDPPAAPPEPRVLELRVHGVNNTTPAALLDVPADSVELKSGDKLGSFWQSTTTAAEGRHGFVPAGILREAYSWGGMVRTAPQFGGSGTASKIAAVGARVFYALILPFSIGNAVQWARRITQPNDSMGRKVWIAITAGIARLFGLILTLLFTTTAVTLAIDIGALQCGADAGRCEPLKAVFEPMQGWSPGQRVALLALLPVAAIAVLWAISAVSRLRYDVLPGMEDNVEEAGAADDAAADADAPATDDQPAATPRPPATAVLRGAGVLVEPGHPAPRARAPRRRCRARRGSSRRCRDRSAGAPRATAAALVGRVPAARPDPWFLPSPVLADVAVLLARWPPPCSSLALPTMTHPARGGAAGDVARTGTSMSLLVALVRRARRHPAAARLRSHRAGSPTAAPPRRPAVRRRQRAVRPAVAGGSARSRGSSGVLRPTAGRRRGRAARPRCS